MGAFTIADDVDTVSRADVELTEAVLGYSIQVYGERAGAIEGVPGRLEYIVVEPHWEGKSVARSALAAFVELSRDHGEPAVTTNDAIHPAMEHILETAGFERRSGEIGWVKPI